MAAAGKQDLMSKCKGRGGVEHLQKENVVSGAGSRRTRSPGSAPRPLSKHVPRNPSQVHGTTSSASIVEQNPSN
ncbi:hypothetical protein EYF80_038641 [Liparis tanakae]|uniref:Uncharacterized protein n=1 Tax=Liparis tanakae TaxID=230148 RepID=A0A4Z2GD87_9TELE|nr:hypothetical protein EYF80_038641 [Liparis tanakae]